ncbi:MAG TPA: CHAD domain-containing protein [Steroidobacteraceae bacterium]|nr:CHAD domain-containing protein [Steroidobacteraceae bacterium]
MKTAVLLAQGPRVRSLRVTTLMLLDHAIESLQAHQDEKVVHNIRKTTKRIRAALRLLRECLGPQAFRRDNRRVRDAARPLTAIRDTFVLTRTLATFPGHPLSLQHVLDSRYQRARRTFARQGARIALQQLLATRDQLVGCSFADSEPASATSGVKHTYKSGRKSLRKAKSRNDEALHECRKQAKQLRNQLELLGTVFNARCKKLHRRADRLARALGDDHDLSELARALRQRPSDRALSKQIKKRRRKLQSRAFRLGKRLYRHPAKHLKRTVAALRSRPPDLHERQTKGVTDGYQGESGRATAHHHGQTIQ